MSLLTSILVIGAGAMLGSALYLISGLRAPDSPRAARRAAIAAGVIGALLLVLVIATLAGG